MQDSLTAFRIVCVSDEKYAQHTAVMLDSLFDTNPGKWFDVHILTTGFCAETIDKLHMVVAPVGELHCHVVDWVGFGIGELCTHTSTKAWNPIMYLKCVIPYYLPQDVDCFVFLDVDMVINHDISDLYGINLHDGTIVWACEDYKYQQGHKTRLGLSDDELYINSGVMKVDLNAWRMMEAEIPMIDFLKSHQDILNNDQDVFALYFRGRIGLLPTNQWNATTFFFEQEPRILDKYLPEVDMVRNDPYIIHFCEPVKPWYRDCHHPYQYLYKKYLSQTPWKDYQYLFCGNRMSYSFWKNELKYWLNRWGIRREPMSPVSINQRT